MRRVPLLVSSALCAALLPSVAPAQSARVSAPTAETIACDDGRYLNCVVQFINRTLAAGDKGEGGRGTVTREELQRMRTLLDLALTRMNALEVLNAMRPR